MKDLKHTPAPWIFSGETASLFGHIKIGKHELTINTPAESRERIANAKLIASSPELLEALIEQATDLWHYEYNIAVKSGAIYEAAKKHADNYPKYLKLLALIKQATE